MFDYIRTLTSLDRNTTYDNLTLNQDGILDSNHRNLLARFENFVASTELVSVSVSLDTDSANPRHTDSANPRHTDSANPRHTDAADHVAQPKEAQECNQKRPTVNLTQKLLYSREGSSNHTVMHQRSITSSPRMRNSHKSSSKVASSRYSPSSTHSSPTLCSSNQSTILPSSTHSSPILNRSCTTSPAFSATPSQNSYCAYAPTSVGNGVQKAAGTSDQVNFRSMRDPLTNKITIKNVSFVLKDKKSVSQSQSHPGNSVILKTTISSHVPRTEAVLSEERLKQTDSMPPLELTPLSLKSVDSHHQENLPDLLKPKNLARYVQESAPRKKYENGDRIAALQDHDYSMIAPDNHIEKKQKRKFIIPKKKAAAAAAAAASKKDSLVKDNYDVVDMECSDIEEAGPIIVEEKKPAEESAVKTQEEPCEEAEKPHMYYAIEEYKKGLLLIEDIEMPYTYQSQEKCTLCTRTFEMIKANIGDIVDVSDLESVNFCLLGCDFMEESRCFLEEMHYLATIPNPDDEGSSISHLEDFEEILPTIDAAATDNIEDIDISTLFNWQNSDLQVEPEDIYLDILEEVVEPTESVIVQNQTEKISNGFMAEEVSLFPDMTSSVPETSDTTSISLDESKENMVDKVPAYITNTKSILKKNVLQRLKAEQDSGAASSSRDDTSKKLVLSSEQKSNRNENGAPSTSDFSVSLCRTQSPSPDCSRSHSSHLLSLENHHRRSDRRHYKQSRSQSRSRSPLSRSPLSRGSASNSRSQTKTKENENDRSYEQRRVVFVGKLPNNYTENKLRSLFGVYGEIEKVSLHFRTERNSDSSVSEHCNDNFGFITFKNKRDAIRCLDAAKEDIDHRLELCFGGRRDFCREEYADLDGMIEKQEECGQVTYRKEEVPFDQLLKEYSQGRK